jgi:hypothetical protein
MEESEYEMPKMHCVGESSEPRQRCARLRRHYYRVMRSAGFSSCRATDFSSIGRHGNVELRRHCVLRCVFLDRCRRQRQLAHGGRRAWNAGGWPTRRSFSPARDDSPDGDTVAGRNRHRRERYRAHARGRPDIPNSTVQRHMPIARNRGNVLYVGAGCVKRLIYAL